MEKLQAALEQARERRGKSLARSAPAKPDSVPGAASPPASGWQAVSELAFERRQLDRHLIVTGQAGQQAAPFDILRTKILLQMRQNGWTRLAITSPMPSTGKTTTACNLALGLGRQRDLRAILFDTDLRDPSIHKFFSVKPKHSIGKVLSGELDFAEQAVRIGDNVILSMAQQADPDPTRLLLAEETGQMIDRIEERYKPDIMIFDMPSVLVNDDTRAFLKNVDCALIVVRANVTRYNQFDTCEREIAEYTNVLGVVLNAYSFAQPGQSD